MEQEQVVSLYHLGVPAVLHGLDKDDVAIDFYHNHDVLVALKILGGKLACLVGEHGFVYQVRPGVHVTHFLTMEMGGVACCQWCSLCFGRPYIFLLGSVVPLQF